MPISESQGNSLNLQELNRALAHTPFHDRIRHFPAVPSTNDLALEAAQAGEHAGVWVADAQTAGRGRGNHAWHSAPGDGLYVTALLSPRLPASALQLSLAAGLAAWDAVREVTGLQTDLRWPNDLVTREAFHEPAGKGRAAYATGPARHSRKLGGVLVETSVEPGAEGAPARLRYAVIGIGINVGHRSFPPSLAEAASSLFLEGWQTPERQPLLLALLQHLHRNVAGLERAHAGESAPDLFERLAEASSWLHGKRVTVPEDGGYTGITAGLDAQGFLLVHDEDGRQRTVRSGGVREAQLAT